MLIAHILLGFVFGIEVSFVYLKVTYSSVIVDNVYGNSS